jgi:hypothetical protein
MVTHALGCNQRERIALHRVSIAAGNTAKKYVLCKTLEGLASPTGFEPVLPGTSPLILQDLDCSNKPIFAQNKVVLRRYAANKTRAFHVKYPGGST